MFLIGLQYKVRYSLTVDQAEATALTSLVASCNITSITAFSIPSYAVTAGINPVTLVAPTPTATPTAIPSATSFDNNKANNNKGKESC